MTQQIQLTTIIHESQLGKRLDQALAQLFTNYSRSHIKEWILGNCVQVNGKISNKPKKKVLGKEVITIAAPEKTSDLWEPQNIKLDIIYEEDDILVINKPRNQIVHPGAGKNHGTILNALLHHYPPIANVPRAGIVHRLDKNTTGLMVVAKNIRAHNKLTQALQTHKITREYEGVVIGTIISGSTITQPIARHPTKHTKMAVHPMGKLAVTHYRIIQHFRAHTHLRLRLETGRTHQIRVHMSHIKHPLVGDPLYSCCLRLPKYASKTLINAMSAFDRQALHATTLRLYHPISGSQMEWHAPLPLDMTNLIDALKSDTKEYKKIKPY